MSELVLWWVSWVQPKELHSSFEYHGPWWISGEDDEGHAYTICAAVMAKDEEAAKRVILDAFDAEPGELTWRFAKERDGSPFSDRFPRADWMRWPWPGPDGKPRP